MFAFVPLLTLIANPMFFPLGQSQFFPLLLYSRCCNLYLTDFAKLLQSFPYHLKIKTQQVNGNVVFPGVVLHGTSEEGLGEEETRNPENVGCPCVVPLLSNRNRKLNSFIQKGLNRHVLSHSLTCKNFSLARRSEM